MPHQRMFLLKADYTWLRIVQDTASGNLQEIYSPRATRKPMRKIFDRPLSERAVVFFAARFSRHLFSTGAPKAMALSVVEQSARAAVALLRGV
jgi:hypothetical protein